MMSQENVSPASETNPKAAAQKPPQEPILKCPRCDSANTKFCYYNNYSLTQPRHFCKTCRRYWTKGGALRNVPIGGGCRKTKKLRTSASSVAASISSTTSKLLSGGTGGDFGPGFKFLGPGSTPAMEFQLGGLSLPRLHPATAGVYTQFITSSGACAPGPGTGGCFGLDLLGLNYTLPSTSSSSSSSLVQASGGGGGDHQISISSIESLSSINQEMHWKLQQQRLALIYGPSPVEDDNNHNNNNQEKPQGAINLFKNLDISSTANGGSATRKLEIGQTEWLFDQIQASSPANYGANTNSTISTSMAVTTPSSCNTVHDQGSNLNGVWGDLQHHHQQHQLQFNGLQ